MRVVASLSLLAIATLVKIAHLGLVNTLCDPQIRFTMRKHAILPIQAIALQESPAKLGFVQVRRCT